MDSELTPELWYLCVSFLGTCFLESPLEAKADAQSSGALCRGSGQSKQPTPWILFPSLNTVLESLVSTKATGTQHYSLMFGVKVETLY